MPAWLPSHLQPQLPRLFQIPLRSRGSLGPRWPLALVVHVFFLVVVTLV